MLGQFCRTEVKFAAVIAREMVIFKVQSQAAGIVGIEVTSRLQTVLVDFRSLPVVISLILVLKPDLASVAPDMILRILPMCA